MTNFLDDINLKVQTEMFIQYLETSIGDDMIINNFVRGLKIIEVTQTKVVIAFDKFNSLSVIKTTYLNNVESGIREVFENDLEVELTLINSLNQDKTTNKKEAKKTHVAGKYIFKNYVEGSFNKEAIMISKKIVKTLGKFSPLYITSASGLGKTHLLHAIGNEIHKDGKSAIYIEPSWFTQQIYNKSKADSKSDINYIIDDILSHDVLLFDDIQNLGDRDVTLRVLFTILNKANELNKQVIITSDKVAQELSGFENRFITRFCAGMSTIIKQPTIDDLIKILKFKLKHEGMDLKKWEDEALKFIARNHTSSIRSLEGAVKRVVFFTSSEQNIKYTYVAISNIFKELAVDPSELTPDRVIETVSRYYKISKRDIIGRSRKKDVVVARHMAIWLVKRINNVSSKKIGKIFGNRDHSTILSAINKIETNMKINEVVRYAARQIENRIKTPN